MKPTAVLINTARGELVDEVALADAIKEKRIGGAAIDVFAVEPLPADSPLRALDRLILTPHLAASTAEAQERVAMEICTAVREALVAGDLSTAINVPGMGGDLLRRLAPLLDLARRLVRCEPSRLPTAAKRKARSGRCSSRRSKAYSPR
jgi:D-3-phosphoglycerate dehydrogenase